VAEQLDERKEIGMNNSRINKIIDHLRKQDATVAFTVDDPRGLMVVAIHRGHCLAFVVVQDPLEPGTPAQDMANAVEGAEGQAYFVKDWLDVKDALAEFIETCDDTTTCLCPGGHDDE